MNGLKERLAERARSLGIRKTGFLSVAAWKKKDGAPAGTAPSELWPLVKTVIVLGIPGIPARSLPYAREFGSWNVRDGLLDTAAYRLVLYLNSIGAASVNIPADASGAFSIERGGVPVFDHSGAALQAGISPENAEEVWRYASLFTTYDFDAAGA